MSKDFYVTVNIRNLPDEPCDDQYIDDKRFRHHSLIPHIEKYAGESITVD